MNPHKVWKPKSETRKPSPSTTLLQPHKFTDAAIHEQTTAQLITKNCSLATYAIIRSHFLTDRESITPNFKIAIYNLKAST